MTTTTLLSNADRTGKSPGLPTRKQTLGRAVHAEIIKIGTLRSTWFGSAAVILVLVAFGLISAAVATGSVVEPNGGGGPGFGDSDPVSIVLTGANFAVLLVGVLGCLAGAREYGSGLISTTVAAVPRRWQVVLAKAMALVAAVLPAALIGVLVAFFGGMTVLASGDAATASISDEGVLSSVLGMAFYLSALALIGLGLGVALRSAAGSIGALVAGVLILPNIAAALLPDSWGVALQYLPSSSAAAFTSVMSAETVTLTPLAGVVAILVWVAVAIGVAIAVITRRDA